MNDGRALNQLEIEKIQRNVWQGCYHDEELSRIFETIHVQRRVLKEMFALFKRESPLRNVFNADPLRASQLAHFKELVSMDDPEPRGGF